MKFQLDIDKKTSAALMLTTLGWLAASLSAAQAAPEISPIETVESLSDVSRASEDLAIASTSETSDRAFDSSLTDARASVFTTTQVEAVTPNQIAQTIPSEAEILPLDPESEVEDPMAQVTSVSQLSDVQPTDWAFQALQSLVERYGCIAGYPDGTYRGNRALTRYEFAAGLNACLDRVNELIATATGDAATREDIATLQRLQEEFAAEIATLRGRVDVLEARTTELEANQFSTTTKLFGQVVIGVQGRSDNDSEFFLDTFADPGTNINVITNTQLSLFTQFSPRSILLTGLQAGAGSTAPRNTNDVILGYEGDSGNDVQLSDLSYRQLIGNNFAFIVGTEGVNPVNVFRGANRVESAGQGPLSRFAQRNPIINIGGRGGIGFDLQLGTRIALQGVYSTGSPSDPSQGGIFGGDNGDTSAGVQLNVAATDDIDLAFQYINSYSPFGTLGTGVGDDTLALRSPISFRAPIQTNAFGATVEWRVTPRFTVGAWGGYTTSELQAESGNVETVNYMGYLNFPDLFGEGNLAGIYVGQPPKITSSDLPIGRNYPDFVSKGGFGAPGGQPGTTTHVEAFYRLRLTDNISVTPGVIVIFNPGQNDDNDTITVGALRTTFTF